MSDWLYSCRGCGCSYARSGSSNADFCQYCCRDIIADPAAFKTLAQTDEEKALARAAEVVKKLEKRKSNG